MTAARRDRRLAGPLAEVWEAFLQPAGWTASALCAQADPDAAVLVKLRFFGGMSMGEAADVLGISVRSAQDLWAAVGRPNCLVKIPATDAGIPAIRAAIGQGISVNVTLIFGADRYRMVMDAYLGGLEDARDAGHDLSGIY